MLRGPSGGGKTTLLNMLGTIDRASSGRLEILGEVIDERSSDAYLADLRLRRIGTVNPPHVQLRALVCVFRMR